MTVQSLSIAVPLRGCVNDCPFCVSKMHGHDYPDYITKGGTGAVLDYVDRLLYARQAGCRSLILTGTGEPLQNTAFLSRFGEWNFGLGNDRFVDIALQSTGVLLDNGAYRLLRNTGVKTIALSVCDPWSSENNARLTGMRPKTVVDVEATCQQIVENGFLLRLCLNLTDVFDDRTPVDVFARAKALGASHVTLRWLYESGEDRAVDAWTRSNRCSEEAYSALVEYVGNGRPLERFPTGEIRYSVGGLSTIADADCMARGLTDAIRYLILRPDCRLYTRWDEPGSVLF